MSKWNPKSGRQYTKKSKRKRSNSYVCTGCWSRYTDANAFYRHTTRCELFQQYNNS